MGLTLSRRRGEKIIIGNEDIIISVLSVREDTGEVLLSITADKEITVHREEIFNRISEGKKSLKIKILEYLNDGHTLPIKECGVCGHMMNLLMITGELYAETACNCETNITEPQSVPLSYLTRLKKHKKLWEKIIDENS